MRWVELTKQEEESPGSDVSVGERQIEELVRTAEHTLGVETVQTRPVLYVQVAQTREPVHWNSDVVKNLSASPPQLVADRVGRFPSENRAALRNVEPL